MSKSPYEPKIFLFRFNVGGTVYLVASEDIPTGQEVSDCYGPTSVAYDVESRREKLQVKTSSRLRD